MTAAANTIDREVLAALDPVEDVRSVRLIGSRARGDAGPLSDWDFAVETGDFEAAAPAIERAMARLEPLAAQWDRLSPHACYMLILRGPVKIDLLFLDRPHELEPPWVVSARTLAGIDAHFWDWALWLAAKDTSGKRDLVGEELRKLHEHILAPMGVERVAEGVEQAIELYVAAREQLERDLNTTVPHELGREVLGALRRNGYRV